MFKEEEDGAGGDKNEEEIQCLQQDDGAEAEDGSGSTGADDTDGAASATVTPAASSRSVGDRIRIAKLQLVDLAGSERAKMTGCTGTH